MSKTPDLKEVLKIFSKEIICVENLKINISNLKFGCFICYENPFIPFSKEFQLRRYLFFL